MVSLVFGGLPVAAPGGGEIYGSCAFFYFYYYYFSVSRDRVPSKPVNRFLRIVS